MGRRRRKEGAQSDALTELGFGQDIPSDGFSDQPDSGGRIGGVRGRQEFGIEGGAAQEFDSEARGRGVSDTRLVEDVQASAESLAEWSAEGDLESVENTSEVESLSVSDRSSARDLKSEIEERLVQHGGIHAGAISVSVDPPGVVSVMGDVDSEAERLRVSELLEALPGARAIINRLTVRGKPGSPLSR